MANLILPGTADPTKVLEGNTFSAGLNYGASGTMTNNASRMLPLAGVPLTNLVTNGDFANGTTGYIAGSGTTFTTDATKAKFGINSGKIVTSVAGDHYIEVQGTTILGTYNAIAATASHVYNLSAYLQTDGVATTYLRVIALNSSGAVLEDKPFATINSTIWTRQSNLYNSPANTAGILIRVNAPGIGSVWVDGILCIDLTASFGAGNEPTQAQMDTLITAYGGYLNSVSDSYANFGVPLPSLVVNGSFENGGTGWTWSGTQPTYVTSIKKFGTQSAKFAVTNVVTTTYTDITNTIGHKIYFCWWAYLTGTNVNGRPTFYLADYTSWANMVTAPLNQTILNQWQFASGLKTLTTAGYKQVLDIAESTDTITCYIDGISIIDLTASFGAGNEPTQAEMDTIISAYGGYIDSTTTPIMVKLKLKAGAYVNNASGGYPEVFVTDVNLTKEHIKTGTTAFGIAGTG